MDSIKLDLSEKNLVTEGSNRGKLDPSDFYNRECNTNDEPNEINQITAMFAWECYCHHVGTHNYTFCVCS